MAHADESAGVHLTHRTDPALAPRESLAERLLEQFRRVRAQSDALAAPLSGEDQTIQSMPDASPTKWHLAHTTWFWETLLLRPHLPGYTPFDADFPFLFNSYYESLGPRHPRPQRGLLSRPSVEAVAAYRRHVDEHFAQLMRTCTAEQAAQWAALVELGLAHEQQHQELILMDILHLFAQSPLRPAYRADFPQPAAGRGARYRRCLGGLVAIGDARAAFAFDNERPRHRTWIEPFEIADRLATNREWLQFIDEGGYSTARFWLSDGWDRVRLEGWQAPLYWQRDAHGEWTEMTLAGMQPLVLDAPVAHVSYYEAAAFAAWAGARLPTEAEWEVAAAAGLLEQTGDVAWQWTQSPYTAYPGFSAAADATGEYNGKFMVGQMVLRGGASVTPTGHTRHTYRNFFRPEQRWMFSGVRLARDAAAVPVPAPDGGTNADAEADAERRRFERDVLAGLSKPAKALNPKYFYDARGSALFEEICLTPEYYLTRTETALLRRLADRLAAEIPAHATLVEFGSGASEKTRIVLDAAAQIGTYVPVDISAAALEQAQRRLAYAYPALRVKPIEGDFTQGMVSPDIPTDGSSIGFFPGSTLGNFEPAEAVAFLRAAREMLGARAKMIVGIDMIKDIPTLLAAYNDARGVTAQFNLNLLERINRELRGDFDLDAFDHSAVWNSDANRIEMHLVSRSDQTVHVAGRAFHFKRGERIHTEHSHKYSEASFGALAAAAGWRVSRAWVGEAPHFGVFVLRADEEAHY